VAEVEYFGTVQVQGRTPLLARAGEDDRDEIRRIHSGGVIFTDSADMPSLEELLEAHQVDYAVLEPTAPSADDEFVEISTEPRDWRDAARQRLDFHVEAGDRDELMDEEFAFIAALAGDELDDFLKRAHHMLGDGSSTEEAWTSFLESEDAAVGAADSGSALPPLERAFESQPEDVPAPLFSPAEIRLEFSRGAIGGPAPLVDGFNG
jgi:hypothetical protein